MFEFLFSIKVSFLAVRVGRMPRRCTATTGKIAALTALNRKNSGVNGVEPED